MTETAQEPRTATSPVLRGAVSTRRLVLIMASVLLGLLLAALDQTIVGTAMPRVIADLNGLEHYAWVFTAYMLASTVTVPIYGKLSDLYGRRLFFLLGIALFLAGSALSGMSQTMTQLILFRGVQGLGAGAMLPLAIAITGDIFPPSERGKWQGLTGSIFGLSSIVGPTLGGWLTDNWGWRWVFYVNMPVGALALLTAAVALPQLRSQRHHTIDYLGVATLVAATVPMLLAFSWAGTEYPWGSPQIIGMLAFSAVMLVITIGVELRAREPIISPRLFANSIFTVSVLASFIASAGMFGAIMYLPLFIQGVVGKSATNSGAVLTPMMLGFITSSVVGGYLMSRTGRYKALALGSFAVAAVGTFLLSRMTVEATSGLVIRNMVITGLGLGTTMSLFTIVVQNAFPARQLGEVTAGLQFFRSIGGTIGVAVLGTVMNSRYSSAFDARLPDTLRQAIPPDRLAELKNPQLLLAPEATARIQQAFAAFGAQGDALFNQLMDTMRQSLASAITGLFLISTVSMVLALAATVFLREIPLKTSHVDAATPAAGEALPGEPVGGSAPRIAPESAEQRAD
ncbi:MAG: MDR family MFS transporter [Sphaerobacter sp.]|nr:MDR family MFS transporter [Sphaerobacter sp.]